MKKLISIVLVFAMLASMLALVLAGVTKTTQGQLDLDSVSQEEAENVAYFEQTAWNGTTSDKSWYTDNPNATTFTLKDGADLKGFIDLVHASSNPVTFEGKTVELANDINLGLKDWQIPTALSADKKTTAAIGCFKGTFDGKGYTIGGFLTKATTSDQSLLGVIGGDATVKDLTVAGKVTIEIPTTGVAGTGYSLVIGRVVPEAGKTVTISDIKIAKYASEANLKDNKGASTASAITISGNCKRGATQIGSIVGSINGSGNVTITNCTANNTVNGYQIAAGIVGGATLKSGTLTITDCTNSGAINLPDDIAAGGRAAGIIADFNSSSASLIVKNCKNTGAISLKRAQPKGSSDWGAWMGGIAGYLHGAAGSPIPNCTFEKCENTGKINAANRSSGGLVGFVQTATELTVKDCKVNTTMTFECLNTKYPAFGGLIGGINMSGSGSITNGTKATIENCSVGGHLVVNDVLNYETNTGGLIGYIRGSDVAVNNCEVSTAFSANNCEADDVINVVVGCFMDSDAYITTQTPTNSKISVTDLTFVSHNNVAKLNSFVDETKISYFKNVGQQYRENADGTYDIRFIFGIGSFKNTEKKLGFEVTEKALGLDVTKTTSTKYVTNVYTNLKGGDKTYTPDEFGCDYFHVMTMEGVAADKIEWQEVDGNKYAYLKNVILTVVPFTLEGEAEERRDGIGLVEYTIQPERFEFGVESFSSTMPEEFKDAVGIVSSKNIEYPAKRVTGTNKWLMDESVGNNLDVVSYKPLGSLTTTTQGNAQFALQAKDSNKDLGWSANGVIVYLINTAEEGKDVPYHYYIEARNDSDKSLNNYETKFETRIEDLYECYYSFDFNVAETGYYNFCFRIRLNGSEGSAQTRYALVQFDDESYGEQTEFYYNITARTDTLRDNEKNHDCYMFDYGREMTAGKHTITFRLPYNTWNENKASALHIRDIYMVKGNPLPVDADIPKLEGASLYDGSFDTNVTYALDNTTKAVLDAYREQLVSAGFELRDDWTTEYEFNSKFDKNNTKTGTQHNYFYIYTNANYMVYAYYCEGSETIRVIHAEIEEYTKYKAVKEAALNDYEKKCDPMFAILDIGGQDINYTYKDANNKDVNVKINGVTNGMCLVYRLSDGRFIIFDGGWWGTADVEGRAVQRLYNWLCQNADYDGDGDYTNNNITIAAWIFTHNHSDHISVGWKFEEMYQGNGATVQNIMYNFPEYEYTQDIYGTNLAPSYYTEWYPKMHQLMRDNNNLILHTGMTYDFADCNIEILYTHEDFYPQDYFSYNNTSVVYKLTFAGKTFLVQGDLEEPGELRAVQQAGTRLQADFVQPSHHGYNGQIEYFQYAVGTDAQGNFNKNVIAIWPLPQGKVPSLYGEGVAADKLGTNQIAYKWLRETIGDANIHYAVENWVFTDFN